MLASSCFFSSTRIPSTRAKVFMGSVADGDPELGLRLDGDSSNVRLTTDLDFVSGDFWSSVRGVSTTLGDCFCFVYLTVSESTCFKS